MNREGHEHAEFFIGPEVEHTPAYSKRTLFVVGKHKTETIIDLAMKNRCPHVFMGANHSFNSASEDPYWDTVITALLDKGFWVTLDYQAHEHETVLKMLNPGIWQSRLFVPLLGVRIPYVQTSSPNLTIKIDDINFKATNAGVWCLHHHEITDSNRFTDWQDYGTDEVLDVPTPMPPYVAAILPVRINANGTEEPVVDLKKLKPVENDSLNDASIGLDPDSPSQLKPATEESTEVTNITSPEDAAAAYAEGTTSDPLSPQESVKKVKAKK